MKKVALEHKDGVVLINGKKCHLYFTSDKLIEFDDWITDGYRVWQWKDDCSLLGRKKIIYTTDDLRQVVVEGTDGKLIRLVPKPPFV